MAFTCAENSITGCGWKEKEQVTYFSSINCVYARLAVTHALVFIKKDWQLHGRAAAKDDFYYLLVCYFPQSLYKIAENSEKYQITISQST